MAKNIDKLGGSCIIEKVDNKRRDTDYDGYGDYDSITIEKDGVVDKPACKNCLNAYNSPYTTNVLCCNKEFMAQFEDIDTSVRPDEVCGTYTRRLDSQPRLNFQQTMQLTINFEL